ncbi:MAG: CDP-glycerol glycerophosphotransferase family protein [Bacteroidales bacterium]|nr:CDP-glycerol glycerophosphotransferase family protein [Bacteroidales bacterium]
MDKTIKLLKKATLWFFQQLSLIVPVKKNRVTFIRTHFLGSNTTLVFEKIRKNNDLDIQFFDHYPVNGTMPLILNEIKLYFKLLKSKIIITTHGAVLKTRKNICIDLWHGIPIKGMNLMDNTITKKKRVENKIDFFITASDFQITLMNACFGKKHSQYAVLGLPINDLLFSKNESIYTKLNFSNDIKVIFYLPTFRDGEQLGTNCDNAISKLRMKNFEFESFNQFLIQNNLVFVIKPHPYEMDLWLNFKTHYSFSNIVLVFDAFLKEQNIDTYNILGITDILITDYSSVYFDFLLLNRPIIFIPTDLEKYREKRNLLLEPYDFWTPGPKCLNQNDLQNEIVKCLNEKAYYEKERALMTSIFHKYKDGKSSERIVEFIKEVISKN